MTDHVTPDEPFALSPKKTAKRLGVDPSTLYRKYGNAMRSGAIRTLKIGSARRIIWRSILEYIEEETKRGANGRT
jgi:hypothetical protein